MRKALICLCLITVMAGFAKERRPVEKDVSVTGKISSPTAQDIKIVWHNVYDYSIKDCADSVTLNNDGTFRFAFKLAKPDLFYILNGNDYVLRGFYLIPRDSVNVDVDNSTPNKFSYKFSGRGKSVYGNRIHQLFADSFPMNDEFWNNVYRNDYQQFLQFINDRRQKQFEFYRKYLRNKDVPKIVKNDIMDEINYIWGYCRANYLLTRYYRTNNKEIKIDSTYLLFLREIPLNNPKSQFRTYFHAFVSTYIDLLVAQEEEKNKDTNNTDELRKSKVKYRIVKLMFSGLARDIAMSDVIGRMIDWHPTSEAMNIVKSWLEEFKGMAYDTGYVNPLLVKYNKRLELIPGKTAPNFTLEDINGNKVSLSDFRGKIVYIDFWGTWCGPCRDELPYYKALQEKFKGNDNIVFISIALEHNNHDKWVKFVNENSLPGKQLYSDGLMNPVAKEYMINGVPKFMIIGKDGKFIDANAKRPSEPELENELKKYLD